jgi:GNAT superfamily N-acetyltransferase
MLMTTADHRKKGFGKFLLESIQRIGLERNIPLTIVEAAANKNDKFWRHCNFVKLSEKERRKFEKTTHQTRFGAQPALEDVELWRASLEPQAEEER